MEVPPNHFIALDNPNDVFNCTYDTQMRVRQRWNPLIDITQFEHDEVLNNLSNISSMQRGRKADGESHQYTAFLLEIRKLKTFF